MKYSLKISLFQAFEKERREEKRREKKLAPPPLFILNVLKNLGRVMSQSNLTPGLYYALF